MTGARDRAEGDSMKQQGFRIFVTLAFFALLAATPVYAQSEINVGKIDIPFGFTIKDERFPAGEYIVKRATQNSADVLMVRGEDGRGGRMFMTQPAKSSVRMNQGKLVFHRYGDQYFLSQVWTPGDATVHELRKSRQERAVERELAMAHGAAQRITVALVLRRQ